MKDVWLDTDALVALMNVNKSTISRAVSAQKYITRELPKNRGGKGGIRYEVRLDSLPKPIQEKYWEGIINSQNGDLIPSPTAPLAQAGEASKSTMANPAPSKMELAARDIRPVETTSRQRLIAGARVAIVRPLAQAESSTRQAIAVFFHSLLKGELDAATALHCCIANDRNGFDWEVGLVDGQITPVPKSGQDAAAFAKQLGERTLFRWVADYKSKGFDGLLPGKRQKDTAVKSWHPVALELRKRPQGGSVAWIHAKIAEHWARLKLADAPSYDQICRYFSQQCSQIEQLKGRWSGSQLRSKTFYQRRTANGMMPWDEIHADGWTTHFLAPHPVTGEYVTYEIWHAHDIATRYVPPFAVGLSENGEVIAKCLENIIREGGVPLFWLVDSTRIVKNAQRFQQIADRAGFTITHPVTVGNSQANGISENFNKYLDDCARELATYQHPEHMDKLAHRRMKKAVNELAKATAAGDEKLIRRLKANVERLCKGLVFGSRDEALDWIESKRVAFNKRPHGTLGTVRDAESGGIRHLSPLECLEAFRQDGWKAVALEERELSDLFRPHVKCKVVRGMVTPYSGMKFKHPDLNHYLGKEVLVAYDIMDYRQVWVKTLDGTMICVAAFAEATGYRAKTAYEDGEERRALARIRAREKQIEQIEARHPGLAEERGAMVIEGQFGRTLDEDGLITLLPEAEQAIRNALVALPVDREPGMEREALRALNPEHAALAGAEGGEALSYSDTMLWLYEGETEEVEEKSLDI